MNFRIPVVLSLWHFASISNPDSNLNSDRDSDLGTVVFSLFGRSASLRFRLFVFVFSSFSSNEMKFDMLVCNNFYDLERQRYVYSIVTITSKRLRQEYRTVCQCKSCFCCAIC